MRQLIMVALVLLLVGGCASRSTKQEWAEIAALQRELDQALDKLSYPYMTPERMSQLSAVATGEALADMPPLDYYSVRVPPIEPIQVPLPAVTTGRIGNDSIFLQTYSQPFSNTNTTVGHIGQDNVFIQYPK